MKTLMNQKTVVKHLFRMLFLLGTIIILLVGCTPEAKNETNSDQKLIVYTSVYPMYDFASKIGEDRIQVKNLIPDGTEPHDWEPSATDIVCLEKADIFIYSGAGMEHWIPKVLGSLSNKALVAVETSASIALLSGEAHSQEIHDNKDEAYDPHVWLDPMNAKKQMMAIKDAFVSADRSNKAFYEKNFEKYSQELDKLDSEYKQVTESAGNKRIVVSHEAYGYLCNAYGLTQMAIKGLTPDSEPDAAKMVEIIKFVKNNNISVIFYEELANPKVAQAIAVETGTKVDELSPIEGRSERQKQAGDDYFTIMRANLEALKQALK